MEEPTVPDLTIPPASTTTPTPPAPRPALSEEAELEQFIAEHGLRADLDKAIAISREAFPAGSRVVVRLQYFPDDDETRVLVDVRLAPDVVDAVQLHEKLLDRWTRELPLRAQGLLITTFTRS
jgi:hypothetical protein